MDLPPGEVIKDRDLHRSFGPRVNQGTFLCPSAACRSSVPGRVCLGSPGGPGRRPGVESRTSHSSHRDCWVSRLHPPTRARGSGPASPALRLPGSLQTGHPGPRRMVRTSSAAVCASETRLTLTATRVRRSRGTSSRWSDPLRGRRVVEPVAARSPGRGPMAGRA